MNQSFRILLTLFFLFQFCILGIANSNVQVPINGIDNVEINIFENNNNQIKVEWNGVFEYILLYDKFGNLLFEETTNDKGYALFTSKHNHLIIKLIDKENQAFLLQHRTKPGV